MVAAREKFSSQARPELLERMRDIARKEGRHFQAVLEDAMSAYIESKTQERGRGRPEFMGHFYASLERNRRLGELLGKS